MPNTPKCIQFCTQQFGGILTLTFDPIQRRLALQCYELQRGP